MERIEYYEDDLERILDIDDGDCHIYVFKFLGDQDDIYRMYDSEYNGECSEDHMRYVGSNDEIAFMFSPYEDPAWPITVEYEI